MISLRDQGRDAILSEMGLKVLRFDNLQVLKETHSVVEEILEVAQRRVKIPA